MSRFITYPHPTLLKADGTPVLIKVCPPAGMTENRLQHEELMRLRKSFRAAARAQARSKAT